MESAWCVLALLTLTAWWWAFASGSQAIERVAVAAGCTVFFQVLGLALSGLHYFYLVLR